MRASLIKQGNLRIAFELWLKVVWLLSVPPHCLGRLSPLQCVYVLTRQAPRSEAVRQSKRMHLQSRQRCICAKRDQPRSTAVARCDSLTRFPPNKVERAERPTNTNRARILYKSHCAVVVQLHHCFWFFRTVTETLCLLCCENLVSLL